MEIFLIILIIILIVSFGIFAGICLKKINDLKKPDSSSSNAFVILQNQIESLLKDTKEQIEKSSKNNENQVEKLRKEFGDKMESSNKNIFDHLRESIKQTKEITSELENLKGTNKQILDLSGQIRGLEDILKNSKQRGILGEYFLENLLKNLFSPDQYQMQYKIGYDEKLNQDVIVDAAIFNGDLIIPIDSKFSLDNYNKLAEAKDEAAITELERIFKADLKKRIDETGKYVRPDLKTTDFAFMFIPAEGIYYELLSNKIGSTENLIEYAFKKHVIIVSPVSFFAYLQTVLQGLKNAEINKNMDKVKENIEKLGKHLMAYDDYMKKMGNNLGTVVNGYNLAYKEFKKIDKDVYKISGVGGEIEVLEIEKPGNNDESEDW